MNKELIMVETEILCDFFHSVCETQLRNFFII